MRGVLGWRCPLCGERATGKHDLSDHIYDGHDVRELANLVAEEMGQQTLYD
jgi:hypothetical protein